jgi:hypothetical protein
MKHLLPLLLLLSACTWRTYEQSCSQSQNWPAPAPEYRSCPTGETPTIEIEPVQYWRTRVICPTPAGWTRWDWDFTGYFSDGLRLWNEVGCRHRCDEQFRDNKIPSAELWAAFGECMADCEHLWKEKPE